VTCKHNHLGFSSGGFYIHCLDCNAQWVARKIGDRDDDFDYDRSHDGLTMGDKRTNDDMDVSLDAVARKFGFESEREFNHLVATTDISSAEKNIRFKAWQETDGYKDGLDKVRAKNGIKTIP
jgi:hypothetical protein